MWDKSVLKRNPQGNPDALAQHDQGCAQACVWAGHRGGHSTSVGTCFCYSDAQCTENCQREKMGSRGEMTAQGWCNCFD